MAVELVGVPDSIGAPFYDEWEEREVVRFRLFTSDLPIAKDKDRPYMEQITAPASMVAELTAAAAKNKPVRVVCRVKTVTPRGKEPFAAFKAVKLLAD